MKFSRCLKSGVLVLWVLLAADVCLAAAQQLPPGNLATTVKDFSRMSPGQKGMILNSLGLSMGLPGMGGFSLAKMIAWTIFGGVGFIAFAYGKKQESFKPLIIGILLMAYPYFFNGTLALYGIGAALCLVLYYWRD